MGDRKNDNSGLFAMPEDERFLISDHVEDIEKHKNACYDIYYYKETGFSRWFWFTAEKNPDLQSFSMLESIPNLDLGEIGRIAEAIPLVDIVDEKSIYSNIQEIRESTCGVYLCNICTANEKLINKIRSVNRAFDIFYGVSQIENIFGNLNRYEIGFAIQWWKRNYTVIDKKISLIDKGEESFMEYPINPWRWSSAHWKWFVESIQSVANYQLYIDHVNGDYLPHELKKGYFSDVESLVGRAVEVQLDGGNLIQGIVISEGGDGRILVNFPNGEHWIGWEREATLC